MAIKIRFLPNIIRLKIALLKFAGKSEIELGLSNK